VAIEENLDELYALFIANSIMSTRLWAYLAMISAQTEGISEAAFIDRHARMSVQSVDLWDLGQNPRASKIKERATIAIKQAFRGIVAGAPPSSRPQ